MIYFLRHGLDDESYIGGWSNVSLTKEGILEVKNVASRLKDFPIKKIISSDVLRARETSEIVSTILDVPVTYTDRLRELNKGILNGMDKEEAKEKYNEYLSTKDITKIFPEGESLLDLYNRIKIYLEEILKEDDTLFITHRGVINMIYFILNDIPLDYNKKRFGVTHASLHELDKEKMKIKKLF